jgi:hypothetical protein
MHRHAPFQPSDTSPLHAQFHPGFARHFYFKTRHQPGQAAVTRGLESIRSHSGEATCGRWLRRADPASGGDAGCRTTRSSNGRTGANIRRRP